MAHQKPITGKVAKIISKRTLALNIGEDDGVQVGLHFRIIDGQGKEITDPDSGEALGVNRQEKISVEVTQVDKKFSIAKTYQFHEENVGGYGSFGRIPQMLTPPNYVKKFETFEIEDETEKEISEEQSIVKIGDIAQQILEENL